MTKTERRSGGFLRLALAVVALVFLLAVPAGAKAKWVYKDGAYRYQDSKGKLQKGMQKIGKKTYFFDSTGAQRNGWQKVGSDYYYFKPKNKSKGYLVTNKVVDGIYVDANGRANITGEAARQKLRLMAECQQVVQYRCTPKQTKAQKKRTMFYYMMHKFTVKVIPDLTQGRRDYDVAYAQWLLDRGYGDCYCYAGLYTYLLNAIGYSEPLFVASGGHAWSELGGKVYDTNWAKVIGFDKCYAVPSYLSGVDGRPKWAQNRLFIFSVNDTPRR